MKLLLIGAGNMGGAMIEGLKEYDLTVVESYEPRVKELLSLYPKLKILKTIPDIDGFVVILAVKPQALSKINCSGSAEGVISILAGTPIERVKTVIKAKSYIRAMPNIAAIKRKAVISVCGDEDLKDAAMEVLGTIGKCFWLNSENELDIATGIGGSAPAWIALVTEALSDGAVKLGLKRDISYQYVAYMLEGTAQMLKETHPAILKDMVTSPGGTTAAGSAKLEEGKVRDSFIKAMEECYKRTQNL